jgi:hypothetical protein
MRYYPMFPWAIPHPGIDHLRVTHPFATLPQAEARVPVRLACLRRAASVSSEPGSNSPSYYTSLPHLRREASLLCFVFKPSPLVQNGSSPFCRTPSALRPPPSEKPSGRERHLHCTSVPASPHPLRDSESTETAGPPDPLQDPTIPFPFPVEDHASVPASLRRPHSPRGPLFSKIRYSAPPKILPPQAEQNPSEARANLLYPYSPCQVLSVKNPVELCTWSQRAPVSGCSVSYLLNK